MRKEPVCQAGKQFASCHAATVVEAADGDLLCAWFAGTREGHPDVAIWGAPWHGGTWGAPQVVVRAPGVPLWNPVLFRHPQGDIWLFFKAGPAIPAWTAAYARTRDGGRTWTPPAGLPAGLLGPTKNKPIVLSNGNILAPTSSETWRSWACWMESSSDGGRAWSRHGPIVAPMDAPSPAWDEPVVRASGLIQPAVWEYAPGRLKAFMRATPDIGVVCASTSDDYGRTWAPTARTGIPNPNSGLDAIRLSDGRLVLACNPTREGRTPLALLISRDNGETWPGRLNLEAGEGEYSYPSLIQAQDGTLHCVYTHRRQGIAWVALSPDELPG